LGEERTSEREGEKKKGGRIEMQRALLSGREGAEEEKVRGLVVDPGQKKRIEKGKDS